MFDIDIIIPCYGKSELINKGIASIAFQWRREFIHVTLVNDCSPNTDCDYQDLIDRYKSEIDIRCIRTPRNVGQGLARQYGIDHTDCDYFMFMDEDDMLGNHLAVSMFCGAVEAASFIHKDDGSIRMDGDGHPLNNKDAKPVAIASAPLFVFDEQTSYTIESSNHVWVNSKLYSRAFLDRHSIRFNEAQSRHAEDYYFTECFFFCLDNDPEYQGILMDNGTLFYLWYPNVESQSRRDPEYGYMLSGYTMDGSVNVIRYMQDSASHLEWTENTKEQYRLKLLNMTMYSYFTFLSFIKHVQTTGYVPEPEDWYILQKACNALREMLYSDWDRYTYTERIENYFVVKNHTDVKFTEPWVSFSDYICTGCKELKWSIEELLQSKDIKHSYRE